MDKLLILNPDHTDFELELHGDSHFPQVPKSSSGNVQPKGYDPTRSCITTEATLTCRELGKDRLVA